MVQLFIFLLAFGSLNCAPSSSPADEASDEVVDNGEGVHHPEAVAGDLNNFLNVIQNVSSPTPTPKHPKDLRLGEGNEVNEKVFFQTHCLNHLFQDENEERSEVKEDSESDEGSEVEGAAEVEDKKSTGVVEEQFLENMKNYNNLKDALTSLSSDMDKVRVYKCEHAD